jgi:hypothetical protein
MMSFFLHYIMIGNLLLHLRFHFLLLQSRLQREKVDNNESTWTCPMLGGANGFSFQFQFLYCTGLCLIVEGAQGNYNFVIIILGQGLNPFWFNPRFKVTSLSSFLT